jgi:NAD-dependent dihydropyrimidine dehydrogenase PreA subunit
MIALLLEDRCTACQRCVVTCPRNVFDERDGAPPVIARADDCQTCFQCELYCDADALFVEPTVDRLVPVDEARVRAGSLLGVYRRDSGWGEWAGDPRYPNRQWQMEEVFARGRAFHAERAAAAAAPTAIPPNPTPTEGPTP